MTGPPESHRIPSLDGLRAVSILLVIFAHIIVRGEAPPAVLAVVPPYIGDLGVLIFFVISGYLITSLLLGEIDRGVASLPRFYARRFVRLAPAQLAYIGTLFLLTRLTSLHMSACQFATALTYTKNYAVGSCAGWVDFHLWSLSVEEQFYLLWPMTLVLLPRRYAIGFAVLMLALGPASRALQYVLGTGHFDFFWLSSNIDELMIGCLLAIFRRSPILIGLAAQRPAFGRLVAASLAMAPIFLAKHLMFGAVNVLFGRTVQALAAAYLILSYTQVRQGWTYRILNTSPARWLGVLSYSLYLWQQLFFSEPAIFGVRSSPMLTFPINIMAAFGAALLSYRLLERPLLRLRRALAARGAKAAATAEEGVMGAVST